MNASLIAIVMRSDLGSLLVRDLNTGDEILVLTHEARKFSPGDRVAVTYSGMMTHSIPPQITALSIRRLNTPPIQPPESVSEMRGTIVQQQANLLVIRDMNSNRLTRVVYRYAHHFCVRQRVLVQYDTIKIGNPPEVTATEVFPLC